jgi:hypothetical protein
MSNKEIKIQVKKQVTLTLSGEVAYALKKLIGATSHAQRQELGLTSSKSKLMEQLYEMMKDSDDHT